MRYLELLAPARNLETGRVAVDFGADALYIGGARFGARRVAANSTEDIAELVRYAHAYGVKVYATMNTVIFEQELDEAEHVAKELQEAGVDALIVQDMAFARMKSIDSLTLHASTQTCNVSPEGVSFLEHAGFSRVILERGLTLEQIRSIRAESSCELEAFVHGAICVGYSGQCYMSRTMSARSGNRGDCQQSCRMSYDLIDAHDNVIIRGKHLLSVQDLNLAPDLGQLIDAGVDSFKIEGRLKDASYIKNVVGYYRKQLDRHIAADASGTLARSSVGRSIFDFTPDPERSFTRSGSSYMLHGKRAGVASFDTPKAMGSYIGQVIAVTNHYFSISPNPFVAGDGICFVDGRGKLCGTNINRVEGERVFANKMDDIESKTEIFRNHDHRFVSALESSRTRRVIDVDALLTVSATSAILKLTDGAGVEIVHAVEHDFDQAQNPEKMLQTLRTQIAKSGDTIFALRNIDVEQGSEKLFVPVSVLNELRRSALEMLRNERIANYVRPERAEEQSCYPFPEKTLGLQMNVVNSVSEQFYRDHGVETIAAGLDMRQSESEFVGERVMTCSYCLRREIGECLLESPQLRGELYLQRAEKRYKLEFDCKKCQMHLLYEI